MKRIALIRRISMAAHAAGRTWGLVRQGSSHEIWRLGGRLSTIPRPREITEVTATAIMLALEAELGEGWWRR